MKIQIVSDLHLEFSDVNIQNQNNADVLILGGDIMLAEKVSKPESELGQRFRDFLSRVSSQFSHVIYIAGNHEFYGGYWQKSLTNLEFECLKYENIYFLERSIKIIDDVLFIGGTLWTDMNKYDPLTLHAVQGMMNDYRAIHDDTLGYTKLKPATTAKRHKETIQYIKHIIDENPLMKTVVVGHHTPSYASCHEQYKSDYIMNGAYHSDLSEFILDHPQIKLWTHGHTHHCFDYMIGSTRIVCNPRGYDSYEETGWDPNKIVEV